MTNVCLFCSQFNDILGEMADTMNNKICPTDDMKCDDEEDTNLGIDECKSVVHF